jgi:hypothetical protein
MGSFANSVHVKCDDVDKLVASIDRALREAGYEPTDEEPNEETKWVMPSAVRAIHVTASRNGWVAVLDSDLSNSDSLASDLSRHLETHTIQFLVHDSDSWHYQLFFNGSQLDQFHSSGSHPDDCDLDETSCGDFAAMKDDLEQRVREFQERMESNMPPDLRDIRLRTQTGAVTHEEMQRYGEWAQTQAQQLMGEIKGMVAGAEPSVARPSAPESSLDSHIEKLRPVRLPHATDSRVREVLGKQVLFAEETLAEFMEIIGVNPFFATLSYWYLSECTERDLQLEDVRLVAHLKFATETPAS